MDLSDFDVAWQADYPSSGIQSYPAPTWHIPHIGDNLSRNLLSCLEPYSPEIGMIFHQLEKIVYITRSAMSPGLVVVAMSP